MVGGGGGWGALVKVGNGNRINVVNYVNGECNNN